MAEKASDWNFFRTDVEDSSSSLLILIYVSEVTETLSSSIHQLSVDHFSGLKPEQLTGGRRTRREETDTLKEATEGGGREDGWREVEMKPERGSAE